MTTAQRPLVAVLVSHWESRTEEGWITRQVAGSLAAVADVHVITPDGQRPATGLDWAFTVHRLGTPLTTEAEIRRDLVVESLVASGAARSGPIADDVSALVDRDLLDGWMSAADVLTALDPDHIVVAGSRAVGAVAAVDAGAPSVPLHLLALGSHTASLEFPHFDQVVNRADTVMTVTELERQAIIRRHGRADSVFRIGAPLAANPSSLNEPNTWVGATDYVLVITASATDDDSAEYELTRLLRLRFPDNPVGIAHSDAFCAWHQGSVTEGWPIERSSDMARLMAWARVTVDLCPGPLFARRCVDSLLYGTPIVVPDDSRAREHAQRGRGGLWFSDAAELIWCTEALLDPSTRATFSAQGRTYAEDEYGSTDRFIERVLGACSLASSPKESVVSSA
jgi:hypothetical protein